MKKIKNNVSLEATPTGDTHVTNKGYVDEAVKSLIDDSSIRSNRTWSSEKISKIDVKDAKKVDALPTYSAGTITYVKDGISYTTTNDKQWFYYLENGSLKQTIFIEGEELTIDGASVDFDEFVKNEELIKLLVTKQPILKHVLWSLDDLNRADRTEVSYGYIDTTTAISIGITEATDFFHVIYLPWDVPYPTEILVTCSGQSRMYLRSCSDGIWSKPKEILTKNQFISLKQLDDGTTATFSSWVDGNSGYPFAAIELAKSDGTIKKFQFNYNDNTIHSLRYDGTTWIYNGRFVLTKVDDTGITNVSDNLQNGAYLLDDGCVNYTIKNGKCHLNIVGLITTTTAVVLPSGTLPSLNTGVSIGHFAVTNSQGGSGLAVIGNNGQLTIYGVFPSTAPIYASIEYPVAE